MKPCYVSCCDGTIVIQDAPVPRTCVSIRLSVQEAQDLVRDLQTALRSASLCPGCAYSFLCKWASGNPTTCQYYKPTGLEPPSADDPLDAMAVRSGTMPHVTPYVQCTRHATEQEDAWQLAGVARVVVRPR